VLLHRFYYQALYGWQYEDYWLNRYVITRYIAHDRLRRRINVGHGTWQSMLVHSAWIERDAVVACGAACCGADRGDREHGA